MFNQGFISKDIINFHEENVEFFLNRQKLGSIKDIYNRNKENSFQSTAKKRQKYQIKLSRNTTTSRIPGHPTSPAPWSGDGCSEP